MKDALCLSNRKEGLYNKALYVKKPECPVLCTGVKGKGLGVQAPKPIWFFHWKKLPTFGRGSYGWGVTCLGHAHPVIIKALSEQEEMEEGLILLEGVIDEVINKSH